MRKRNPRDRGRESNGFLQFHAKSSGFGYGGDDRFLRVFIRRIFEDVQNPVMGKWKYVCHEV